MYTFIFQVHLEYYGNVWFVKFFYVYSILKKKNHMSQSPDIKYFIKLVYVSQYVYSCSYYNSYLEYFLYKISLFKICNFSQIHDFKLPFKTSSCSHNF